MALLAILGCVGGAAAPAQPLRIVPTLVDCIEAGRAASIVVSFRPGDRLARATLYFRSGGTRAWYSVEMRPQGNRMMGLIPPPLTGTGEVEYSFEAVDRETVIYRTAPFRARVVSSSSECGGRVAGAVSDVPAMVFGVEEGAPPKPAGFRVEGLIEAPGVDSASDVASSVRTETPAVAGTAEPPVEAVASGEGVPAAEAAETAGGGGFPVAVVLLGAAGAAAGAIAVSSSDDAGNGPGGAPPGSGPVPTPTPLPPLPPGGEGLAGRWEAEVVEVGEFEGLLCKWASTVFFDFRLEDDQAVAGTSTTSTTQPSAAECGGREPPGQAFPLRGGTDGNRFHFQVEAPAPPGAPIYDGTLQGDVISGTMRRDSGTEGSWTAQRR